MAIKEIFIRKFIPKKCKNSENRDHTEKCRECRKLMKEFIRAKQRLNFYRNNNHIHGMKKYKKIFNSKGIWMKVKRKVQV